MPIKNIYNAAYSLQVQAGGDAQPWVVAWTQKAKLYIGWGVSGTRNSGENPWGSSKHLKNKRCWLVPVPSVRL